MTPLDDALSLASAGWAIFPVDARTKRPRTAHGHLDATSDAPTIQAWQSAFDIGGAIATPTGHGLLVIDIDPRNGGAVPPWAPVTRTVTTQSGGLHLHYAIDEDIKSRAGLFGPGVDAKCAGGYVLIPPSAGYTWTDISPRTTLKKEWVMRHIAPTQQRGASQGATRLPASEWRRGIIHDQVVAWASYFAVTLGGDDDLVWQATWTMVQAARDAGVVIDDNRGHIGASIRWVLDRERSKGELG